MEHLEQLRLFDPALASFFTGTFRKREHVQLLLNDLLPIDDLLKAWTLSAALVKEIGSGLLILKEGKVAPDKLQEYRVAVLTSADKRVVVGEAIASLLPKIYLLKNRQLEKKFNAAFDLLCSKITVSSALLVMSFLATLERSGRMSLVDSYLEVVMSCYSQPREYEEIRLITSLLPEVLKTISPRKLPSHLNFLRKISSENPKDLLSALRGIANGLRFLDSDVLYTFYDHAKSKIEKDRELGHRFLALQSASGRDHLESLRSAISLADIKTASIRYLEARIGLHCTIEALANQPELQAYEKLSCNSLPSIQITSNGKTFFLPEEIDSYPSRAKNLELAKGLLRLEAGLYEWHSYDFDLEKLIDTLNSYPIHPELCRHFISAVAKKQLHSKRESDFSLFFSFFSAPEIARDIFTLCEHRRLGKRMESNYPGMARMIKVLLRDEIQLYINRANRLSFITLLYYLMVVEDSIPPFLDSLLDNNLRNNATLVCTMVNAYPLSRNVEDSAALTIALFPMIFPHQPETCLWSIPFARRFDERSYFQIYKAREESITALKSLLNEHDCKVYRSELRPAVDLATGSVSVERLKSLLLQKAAEKNSDSPLSLLGACRI